jgi:hypothetical protein
MMAQTNKGRNSMETNGNKTFYFQIHSLLIILIFIFITNSYANENSIDIVNQFAEDASNELIQMINLGKSKTPTIIIPFRGYSKLNGGSFNEFNDLGNSDERYFNNCLMHFLIRSSKFKVYNRDKLDFALKELNLQFKNIFDHETVKIVGKFVGAELIIFMEGYIGRDTGSSFNFSDYICEASFTRNRGAFKVVITAVEVETAEIKGYWNKFQLYKGK